MLVIGKASNTLNAPSEFIHSQLSQITALASDLETLSLCGECFLGDYSETFLMKNTSSDDEVYQPTEPDRPNN